jgi:hypothetical protein
VYVQVAARAIFSPDAGSMPFSPRALVAIRVSSYAVCWREYQISIWKQSTLLLLHSLFRRATVHGPQHVLAKNINHIGGHHEPSAVRDEPVDDEVEEGIVADAREARVSLT